MVGGKQAHFDCVEPIMRSFAKHVQLWRRGQRTDHEDGESIGHCRHSRGLSEALHFAECAGLDIDEVTKAIQGGAAQSWQMNNRASTMAKREYDFGFAIDWMRKDLGFALDVASGLVFTYRSQQWSILNTPMCKKTVVVDGIRRG